MTSQACTTIVGTRTLFVYAVLSGYENHDGF